MNAVIGQMPRSTLAKMNERKNRVQVLSIIQLGINSIPNKSTGNSPLHLKYGCYPTVSSDLIDGNEETQNEFF